MDALLFWLLGFSLSVATCAANVCVIRWSRTLPPFALRGKRSLGMSFANMILSLGPTYLALAFASKNLIGHAEEFAVLIPAAALGGWSSGWIAGLERYADDHLVDRAFVTGQKEVSLGIFGVCLIGIAQLLKIQSPYETISICAFLLPIYLLFSVKLFQVTYPDIPLDNKALGSSAWRHALGFALLATIVLASQSLKISIFHDPVAFTGFWFLGSLFGTYSEMTVKSKLVQAKPFSITKIAPTSPSLQTAVTVPQSESLPTVTAGQSTIQKP